MSLEAVTISQALDEALKGALLAGLLWLARHFKKNRATGRERDKAVTQVGVTTEQALKEFGTQLGVVVGLCQDQAKTSAVLVTRMDNLERTMDRLQDEIAELRRRA